MAERTPGFSLLRMREIFQEIHVWETVLFRYSGLHITVLFSILPHNGYLLWRWVLISLGLTHTCNLHRWRIQWLEALEKWPCGDCFTFYSVMLRYDVLIENNKCSYIIMQNNEAMKIVNFTHAQTAETKHSFHRLWTPGAKLRTTHTHSNTKTHSNNVCIIPYYAMQHCFTTFAMLQ